MIIRGATGRKLPYGRVFEGDVLYFINNNAEAVVKAKAVVDSVYNSDKMSVEESVRLAKNQQAKLHSKLSDSMLRLWVVLNK